MALIANMYTSPRSLSRVAGTLLLFCVLLLWTACQQQTPEITSQLEGRITVASSVDTSSDYSNFRILVFDANGRQIDTLAHAVTDRDGRFQTTVRTSERGIFPLTVWGRQGQQRLASANYVVAPGDTATLNVEFPLKRPLQIESPENVALLAYQNTLTMHRRMLTRRLQAEAYQASSLSQSVRQTSSILWSLQDNYPNTYASQLAAVESLSLLEGWNDSLVVARAKTIGSSNPRFVDVVRISRRATARLHGQQAALALLDTFEAEAQSGNQKAAVKAARIQAFLDSTQTEAALSAAQQLQSEHPNTQWADWADRAQYEAEHLMPGMDAPNLSVRTIGGDSVSLDALRGHPVVLEYFQPGSDAYERQLVARNSLYSSTRPDSVAFISISTEPDSVVNRAFFNNQSPSGYQVIAPAGFEDSIVQQYNVVDTPTRFLIDSDGRIVGEYQDSALLGLRLALTRLLNERRASSDPQE